METAQQLRIDLLFVPAGSHRHHAFAGNDGARTVFRLSPSRRVISRTLMPSWWSRKTALRLSVSIMEFFQTLGEDSGPTQNPRRQKMGLSMKGTTFNP